jgi:hypothetical protein
MLDEKVHLRNGTGVINIKIGRNDVQQWKYTKNEAGFREVLEDRPEPITKEYCPNLLSGNHNKEVAGPL